jgi:signal transduction histidine kinase
LLQLVVHGAEFRVRGETVTLVSLQNIQSELEEKELEAWQNLIRVLTHEIMNSITPISSLASTAHDLIGDPATTEEGSGAITGDTIVDIRGALNTIHKRSQGLLHFVETYRSLTKIPRPRFQLFGVQDLFDRVGNLMGPQAAKIGVAVSMQVDPKDLMLEADPGLVEEVLINLVTNAMQALENTRAGRIGVSAFIDRRGRVIVEVSDNGPGIGEEALEKVFIPFYTTKANGSGIGLSLCREIMRMHRGTIHVRSKPGEETVFTMRF